MKTDRQLSGFMSLSAYNWSNPFLSGLRIDRQKNIFFNQYDIIARGIKGTRAKSFVYFNSKWLISAYVNDYAIIQ
jgi:hypothetical protein